MASYFCPRRDLPEPEQCETVCGDCERQESEAYDRMQAEEEAAWYRNRAIQREVYGDPY